ncbi:MAG: hypothetical protein ACKO9B_10450 [Planctomycetota bacterium]
MARLGPARGTAERCRWWLAPLVGWLAVSAGGDAHLRADGLDDPVSGAWTAVPVADLARTLAERCGRPVIIDRRVDRTIAVDLAADDEPIASLLARLAAAAGARAVSLEAVIVFLPPADALPVAAAERRRERDIRALPGALRRQALAAAPWSWPDGAVPRDLVRDEAAAAGIALVGIDDVPHDHFRAAALPPLPLAERLDLILRQFDRRVDWSTLPADSTARPLRLPIVALGDGLEPTGRDRPPREPLRPSGERRPAAARDPAHDRFTLRAEAPLGELLAAVSARLRLELVLDDAALAAAGVPRGRIVRVDVRDATRGELLDAILGPLGLQSRIVEKRLEVGAAGKP